MTWISNAKPPGRHVSTRDPMERALHQMGRNDGWFTVSSAGRTQLRKSGFQFESKEDHFVTGQSQIWIRPKSVDHDAILALLFVNEGQL